MIVDVLLSEDAEAAIYEANRIRALLPKSSRRRTAPKRAPQTERVLLEMAVGRVVGFAELYLLMRATRRLLPDALRPTRPPNPGDPMLKKIRSAARSFSAMRRVWHTDLGIDLKALTVWPDFEVLRELRHVLVHRLGAWEPILDPKPALHRRIGRPGIAPDLYRGPIPLDREDLERAIELSTALVDEVEKTLP